MKTPKVGNPLDSKTIAKDVATVAGVGAGAIAADVINGLEVVQKQDKDLVDGGLFVIGVGAGMALKGNDPTTSFIKMTGFTLAVSSAIRAYKRHAGPVAGQNSWLSRKRRGMNNPSLIRSTEQRQFTPLAQRQFAPAAQTQDVFATAVMA